MAIHLYAYFTDIVLSLQNHSAKFIITFICGTDNEVNMTEEERELEAQQQKEERQKKRRAELEKIRSMHGKQKLRYLWDYYKFVILIVIGIVFALNIIWTMVRGALTDVVFQAAVISPDYSAEDTALREDFGDYIGGLKKNQELSFDMSMQLVPGDTSQTSQVSEIKLQVSVAARALDAVLLPDYTFSYLQQSGMLMKLDDVLGKERMDRLKAAGDLAYAPEPDLSADGRQETEGSTGGSGTASEDPGKIPDTAAAYEANVHTEPEDGETIYGVRVDDSAAFSKYALYSPERKVYLGIINNGKNPDMALRFLDFLKGVKNNE